MESQVLSGYLSIDRIQWTIVAFRENILLAHRRFLLTDGQWYWSILPLHPTGIE